MWNRVLIRDSYLVQGTEIATWSPVTLAYALVPCARLMTSCLTKGEWFPVLACGRTLDVQREDAQARGNAFVQVGNFCVEVMDATVVGDG